MSFPPTLRLKQMKPTFAEASVGSAGYSAVRLAHLLWEQGVVSSNLTTPTKDQKSPDRNVRFFYWKEGALKIYFHKRLTDNKTRLKGDFFVF